MTTTRERGFDKKKKTPKHKRGPALRAKARKDFKWSPRDVRPTKISGERIPVEEDQLFTVQGRRHITYIQSGSRRWPGGYGTVYKVFP